MSDRMSQYFFNREQAIPYAEQTVHVVIAKPTRVCNADCSYCSSPPYGSERAAKEAKWSFEDFVRYYDKIVPHLADGATWIWHGGEPMLMGMEFYERTKRHADEIAKRTGRRIFFSMQTNLLGYDEKWKRVFEDVFGGSVSTSFDPDEENRTIKGNPETYGRIFRKALSAALKDGFSPMVLGTYGEKSAGMMEKMYDWSMSLEKDGKSFPVRFNYMHPTGRASDGGEAIKPRTYAEALLRIYERWLMDAPSFTVTPLDQMLKKAVGMDGEGHCPWTRRCGGRFVGLEPDGSVYNCSDFADLGREHSFGNLNDSTLAELFASEPARRARRRSANLPQSCFECEHFRECEGGCMRDAELFENGMHGKFHYCESWKMVFARIKESVLSGEADKIMERYGMDVEAAKDFVRYGIQSHLGLSDAEMSELERNGLPNEYGYSKFEQRFAFESEGASMGSAKDKLRAIKIVVE